MLSLEEAYRTEVDHDQRLAHQRRRGDNSDPSPARRGSLFDQVAKDLVTTGLAKDLKEARQMLDDHGL